ncbi:MAG: hypothetical protein A4E42_01167 [Methanoregulaceae archaeon PtaU1.Bin222]|nr:MAG: hypothetical protein A4E42_01167 [Methanoregulaceae archaeon PtaU1.Bin222]
MAEAADGLSFKPAVAEPACPMGAAVRERVDPLFQVYQQDLTVFDLYHLRIPDRNVLEGSEFYGLCTLHCLPFVYNYLNSDERLCCKPFS